MTTRTYYLTLLNTRQIDAAVGNDTYVYRPLGWSLFLVTSELFSQRVLAESGDRHTLVESDPVVLAQQLTIAIPVDEDVLRAYAKRIDWCTAAPFIQLKRHESLYIPDRDGPLVVNEFDLETGVKRCWGVGTFVDMYAPRHVIDTKNLPMKKKKQRKAIPHLCQMITVIIMS